MPLFLLDTNTCIEILRGRRQTVAASVARHALAELSICSIVWAELLVGAYLSQRGFEQEHGRLTRFLSLAQFPFDQTAAEHYAQIRSHLQPRGLLIGERDLQIAAIARSRDLTLVTHNTNEFNRVPSLHIEDWE